MNARIQRPDTGVLDSAPRKAGAGLANLPAATFRGLPLSVARATAAGSKPLYPSAVTIDGRRAPYRTPSAVPAGDNLS